MSYLLLILYTGTWLSEGADFNDRNHRTTIYKISRYEGSFITLYFCIVFGEETLFTSAAPQERK